MERKQAIKSFGNGLLTVSNHLKSVFQPVLQTFSIFLQLFFKKNQQPKILIMISLSQIQTFKC